jgi:hypothetical protein
MIARIDTLDARLSLRSRPLHSNAYFATRTWDFFSSIDLLWARWEPVVLTWRISCALLEWQVGNRRLQKLD